MTASRTAPCPAARTCPPGRADRSSRATAGRWAAQLRSSLRAPGKYVATRDFLKPKRFPQRRGSHPPFDDFELNFRWSIRLEFTDRFEGTDCGNAASAKFRQNVDFVDSSRHPRKKPVFLQPEQNEPCP